MFRVKGTEAAAGAEGHQCWVWSVSWAGGKPRSTQARSCRPAPTPCLPRPPTTGTRMLSTGRPMSKALVLRCGLYEEPGRTSVVFRVRASSPWAQAASRMSRR